MALVGVVNLPLVLLGFATWNLGYLLGFYLVFVFAFVFWFLLSFWGKKSLNPDDKSTD